MTTTAAESSMYVKMTTASIQDMIAIFMLIEISQLDHWRSNSLSYLFEFLFCSFVINLHHYLRV